MTPMFVPVLLGSHIGDPVFAPGDRLVIDLIAAGSELTFGPALGHFYSRKGEWAWKGIDLRTEGSVGAPFLFAARIFNGIGRAAAAITTAIVTVGSAACDIARASDAACRYDERWGPQAQLAPTVGPNGKQAGLSLRNAF